MENIAKMIAEHFDYPWEYMPEKGKDTIRQLAQKIATELENEKWKAIESAPKDGTSILAFTKEGICEVMWDRDEWVQVPCYSTYDGAGCAALCCQPTHWTHLPPNPTE